jgi:hypothetical protein
MAAAAAIASAGAQVLVVTLGPIGGRQPRTGAATQRVIDDASAAAAAGVEVIERALCVGFYREGPSFGAVSDRGPVAIDAARVVVATGAYDRSLVLPGVDLPGVIGVRAFERLATQGAFSSRHRIGAFAGRAEASRIEAAARDAGCSLTWLVSPAGESGLGVTHPSRTVRRIEGRYAVRRVVLDDGASLAADVVVLGFTQPTYEVQVHLGQTPSIAGIPPTVRTSGSTVMPMLVVGEAAGDVEPYGASERAAQRALTWITGDSLAHEDQPPRSGDVVQELAPDATVCVCEDVSVASIDVAIAEGFGDLELLKRRSGACTGACQGKLCLGAVGEVLQARGLPVTLPTIRPPIRPVSIAALAGGRR